MSNTPRLGGIPVPRGDMGIGMCYQCIAALVAVSRQQGEGPLAAFVPNFAVTMAPMPAGDGLIVLPACFDCMAGTGPAAQAAEAQARRPALLTATGRVPR